MVNISKELADRSDKVQEECFEFIEQIKGENNSIEYSDAVYVFFYTKIAELQLELEKLKNK